MIVLLFALTACAQKKEQYTSPPGYDLTSPVKFILPDALLEISGIAFNNGDPARIYAIQDEAGRVYHWQLGESTIPHPKFGKSGDYEDISIALGTVFVLRSDGTIFTFPVPSIDDKEITAVQEWKGLAPGGEYEGLYADPQTGRVYLLCKTCDADKKGANISGTQLQWTNEGWLEAVGSFSAPATKLQAYSNKKNIKFHPSALAMHPQSGKWYILSSVNKLLVVADANWNVEAAYPLKPSLFLQPEGITFDKNGNLYISNEGDKLEEGNVLKFSLKK